MGDLISRSEMLEHIDRRIQSIDIAPDPLYRIAWEIIRDYVEYEAPAVDAVEVVRCRDCKYWSGRNDKPGEVTAIGYCSHPNHHIMPLRSGWYCADGAKMDGGAE